MNSAKSNFELGVAVALLSFFVRKKSTLKYMAKKSVSMDIVHIELPRKLSFSIYFQQSCLICYFLSSGILSFEK